MHIYSAPLLVFLLTVPRMEATSVRPAPIQNLAVSCNTAKEGHPPYPEITDCLVIQNRDMPRDPGDLHNKPVWSASRPTKAIYRVPRTFRHRTCAVELALLNGVSEERGYWSDTNRPVSALDSVCWGHRWPPPKRDFLGGFITFGDKSNLQLRVMYNGPPHLQSNGTSLWSKQAVRRVGSGRGF